MKPQRSWRVTVERFRLLVGGTCSLIVVAYVVLVLVKVFP